MGNLRSFVRGKKELNGQDMHIPEDKKELAKSLSERMKMYEGKSESELTGELRRSVEQDKKDGTFTPEALEQFASKVTPMLNAEQREKLKGLMNMISE